MRPTIATAGSIHLKHTHGQRIIARSVSLDHKRSTARHRHCSFVARRVHHDRVRAPRKRILAPNDLIGQHERMRPSVDGGGHQHVHKGMGTVDQTDLDIGNVVGGGPCDVHGLPFHDGVGTGGRRD